MSLYIGNTPHLVFPDNGNMLIDSITDVNPFGGTLPGHQIRPKELQMTEQSKEFFHAPYNLSSYLLTLFLKAKYDAKISTLNFVNSAVWIKGTNFDNCINMLTDKQNFVSIQTNDIIFLKRDDVVILLTRSKPNEITFVQIFGTDKQIADELFSEINKLDENVKKLSFKWLVNEKGDCADIVEEWDETVEANLYPFVNDFDTYAQRFIDSKSNILILIGPPGTGKTTFIKHLLLAMDTETYLTYDERVLSCDQPFADFISNSSAGAFVIEDADLFLKSRADGNTMVSRFLNVGDGLIKLKKKKIIFSTNLEHLRDIDSALIRPGRCFDILQFRSLTPSEAEIVADARDIMLPEGQKSYSLAEIFNAPLKVKQQKSIGFF